MKSIRMNVLNSNKIYQIQEFKAGRIYVPKRKHCEMRNLNTYKLRDLFYIQIIGHSDYRNSDNRRFG